MSHLLKIVSSKCNRLLQFGCICFFMALIYSSCQRDAEFKAEEFHFFRVILINNRAPLFKLTSNSIDKFEKDVDVSAYEVRITSPLGDDEFAKNGIFKFTICKPSVLYTIYWKLKSESVWHSLQKVIPTEIPELKQSNIQKNSEAIYIDGIKNQNDDAFFYDFNFFPDQSNPNDFSANNITGFSFINKSFGSAVCLGARLQLWPTLNNDFADRGFVPCVQPFNWNIVFSKKMLFLQKENFVLHQVSNKDFQLINQLKKNLSNNENPMYIGNPSNFDYQNGNMVGHAFAYYRYDDVHVENVIAKENVVNYECKHDGGAIDPNKIKITSVGVNFGIGNNLPAFQWTAKTDTLFFEDYFKDGYNLAWGKPCGFQQKEYKYKVNVGYEIPSTGQRLYYITPELVYDLKPNKIIIDIP